MRVVVQRYVLYLAWIQALVAMSGSLFFSEVLHWTPCILCWYQRILMYPLVLLIAVGILRKDQGIYLYVLPLSILGVCIALYHELLQLGIITEQYAPCSLGVSCVSKFAGWFGFISVPLLSLIAFSVITICLLIYRKVREE